MINDKVSIVVPVYKVEQYIVNTLESIVSQTYKNIELILVDDGSPDKSIQVASDYLADKGVDWKVVTEPNSGLPTARNSGIAAATGEWVICPDSDDYIAPQTIEKMLEAAHNLKTDCVFCGYKVVHDKDMKDLPRRETSARKLEIEKLRVKFLERKLILLVPGMLMKRKIYDRLKYDKECLYDEDIHFMWQLFYTIDSIAYVDADYYNYYMRSTSMVHTLKPEAYMKTSRQYKEMTDRLMKEFPNDKVASKIYPKYRLGGAHVLSKANDFKTFKQTILGDGYREQMSRLVFQKNLKLSIYALIYCVSLRLFYKISK